MLTEAEAIEIKKIATLSRNIRLVAINFLMRSEFVPDVIPIRKSSPQPAGRNPIRGVEVLPSTKETYLLHLLDGICPIDSNGPYELVSAWAEPRTDWKSDVRFSFCHRDHLKSEGLNPEFLARRDELIDSLVGLMDGNLWQVRGYLNSYFEDNQVTGHKVLMFDCAGRYHILDSRGVMIKVPSGGRDLLGQEIGDRVPIMDVRPKLKVVEGEVILDKDLSWL